MSDRYVVQPNRKMNTVDVVDTHTKLVFPLPDKNTAEILALRFNDGKSDPNKYAWCLPR